MVGNFFLCLNVKNSEGKRDSHFFSLNLQSKIANNEQQQFDREME